MHEANYYQKLDNNIVKCGLCSHRCVIHSGKRGICRVRENRTGKLYSLVYGRLISACADPIEKKPLFHFYPGSNTFSIAAVGCNFRCLHCQNSEISQVDTGEIRGHETKPEDLVEAAIKHGCSSIAYTYTEPTIFYEYAFNTAVSAGKKGLKNVFVTNGYISEEPLNDIAGYLDAANIDLKTMRNDTCMYLCGAKLQPVLDNIQRYYDLGIWVEITTLLIPGINDSREEIEQIAMFIKEIDPSIPWHLTAFHPAYKLTDRPPATPDIIDRAADCGKKAGLEYVYHGNTGYGEDTFCPGCGRILIRRSRMKMMENRIENSRCPDCGRVISGFGL